MAAKWRFAVSTTPSALAFYSNKGLFILSHLSVHLINQHIDFFFPNQFRLTDYKFTQRVIILYFIIDFYVQIGCRRPAGWLLCP